MFIQNSQLDLDTLYYSSIMVISIYFDLTYIDTY